MAVPLLDPSRGKQMLTHRGNSWVKMIGRMHPGVRIEQDDAFLHCLKHLLQEALLLDQFDNDPLDLAKARTVNPDCSKSLDSQ